MKRNINKKLLSIVLAALMCMTGIGVFAADLTVESWNATTSVFTATLSGEASDAAVTVGGKAATVQTANTGGKTTITATFSEKLALDTFYPVKVTAGGKTIYNKEVKLQTLLNDTFDEFNESKSGDLRKVYPVSDGNYSIVYGAEGGKLRIVYIPNGTNNMAVGTTHSDFATTQADWQDYTLELDYSAEAEYVNGTRTYYPAQHVRIGIEVPADTAFDRKTEGSINAGIDNTLNKAAASFAIDGDGTGVRTFTGGSKVVAGAQDKTLTAASAVTASINLQIGIKDGKVLSLANGKVLGNVALPDGTARGGGFVLTSRSDANGSGGTMTHSLYDNIKVYKPVDKEPAPVELTVESWNATTSVFTATLSGEASDAAVTVGGKAAAVQTANADGKTTIMAYPSQKLALNTFYPVEVTAGGKTIYEKEIQLMELVNDNFDNFSMDTSGELRKVYPIGDGNYSIVYGTADGKLRIVYIPGGTVGTTRSDFATTQADWQDYTLELDYSAEAEYVNGTRTYYPAQHVRIGIEVPADTPFDSKTAGSINAGIDNTLNKAAASFAIDGDNTGVRTFTGGSKVVAGAQDKTLTAASAVTAPINLQIGIKDGKVLSLANGKVLGNAALPDGTARGGGFVLTSRGEGSSTMTHSLYDNIKVYKAVEKEPAKTYNISYWNATTSAAFVTLDGAVSGTLTAQDAAGDMELKVEKKIDGNKTELTILPDKPFEIGQEYSLQILENGEEAAVLPFKLLQLFADDFDSYQTDKEIQQEYVGSTTSAVAYARDGKMGIFGAMDMSKVYHKDFTDVQKDWQDYTMEFDYTPSTSQRGIFVYMEAHPEKIAAYKDFNSTAVGLEPFRTASTMSVTINASTVQALWGGVTDSKTGGLTYGYTNMAGSKTQTEAQNVQISTKGERGFVLADAKAGGKLIHTQQLPEDALRGGGFVFLVRGDEYLVDNLKIYKAVTPPESRDTMTLEGEEITEKKADFTFSDDVSGMQGSKIVLNQYKDGEISPVKYSVRASGTLLSIVPQGGFADGYYSLKLESGITSLDDSKATESESTRFFRVADGKVSPVANWSSDPAYGESKLFDGTITMTFEQSVDASTISADSVKVYRNGAAVSGAAVAATGNTVTVNLNEPVEFDSKYEVRFTDKAKFTGNYGFPELIFFVPNGLDLSGFEVTLRDNVIHPSTPIGGETISISATVKSNERTESRSAIVTFCVFDANGKMCRIGGERITVAAGQNKDVVAHMQIPDGSGYTIKCFVWDSFENLIGIHEEIWR